MCVDASPDAAAEQMHGQLMPAVAVAAAATAAAAVAALQKRLYVQRLMLLSCCYSLHAANLH